MKHLPSPKNLKELLIAIEQHKTIYENKLHKDLRYPILYRGVPDSNFDLKTSLEREIGGIPFEAEKYHHLVISAANDIQLNVAQKGYPRPYNSACTSRCCYQMQNFEAAVHLRHYGFPSPLMDWSKSPLVSLFFAFGFSANTSENAALYLFTHLTPIRSGNTGKADFEFEDPPEGLMVERHVNQQAVYMYAYLFENGRWVHPPFAQTSIQERADYEFSKITISTTLKGEILNYLVTQGITADFLMKTKDAAVRDATNKYFHLK